MFGNVGKIVSRFPKLVIIFWVILMSLGISGAFWGFGQGNLFSRMASTKSMIPHAESAEVIRATNNKTSGEVITVIAKNVKTNDISNELTALRSDLQEITGVQQVLDPDLIAKEFSQQLTKEKEKQIAKALVDAQPQIDQAISAELAKQNELIQSISPALGAQITAGIKKNIQERATQKITEEANKKIDAEFAKLENPAKKLSSQSGFAIIVTLQKNAPQNTEKKVLKSINKFSTTVRATQPDFQLYPLSNDLAEKSLTNQVRHDLIRGETIGLPIALFLLIVIFGGVLAAGLPLSSAISAITISTGLVWVVTLFTNVDSFVLNILSIIGLALSIDYGLLVVSRFREEAEKLFTNTDFSQLQANTENEKLITQAIINTTASAGRTISFSALTIAFSIAGLLVMQAPMLKMVAMGGVTVAIFAIATAMTLIPAFIKLLGVRLLRPSKLSKVNLFAKIFKRFGDMATETGIFSKLANWVYYRPWRVLITATILLILAALPLHGVNTRSNAMDYIPPESSSAQALHIIERNYPALQIPAITIYAKTNVENAQSLAKWASTLTNVEQQNEIEKTTDGVLINLRVKSTDQLGNEVVNIVKQLRAHKTNFAFYVGGAAASQYDFMQALKHDIPFAVLVIVFAILILIFFMTGSVIAPIKALIVNSLSLVAGIGLTTAVFRYGLFGMPKTGTMDTVVIICALAFGFGLAMDYEVFLLARIKEYWDLGADNKTVIEQGLQRSGRIITAAAAIIIAVFIGFTFSGLIAIRQIGVALAIIIFMDATLVRMFLVPALMTILEKWNWWAPKPLKKLYDKLGFVH